MEWDKAADQNFCQESERQLHSGSGSVNMLNSQVLQTQANLRPGSLYFFLATH